MRKDKRKYLIENIPEEYQNLNNTGLISVLFDKVAELEDKVFNTENTSDKIVNDVFDWHLTNYDIRNIVIAGQITAGEIWDIRDNIIASAVSKSKAISDADLLRRVKLSLKNKKIDIRMSVIRSVCSHDCKSVKSALCDFKDMMSVTGIELYINKIAELILYGVSCNFDNNQSVKLQSDDEYDDISDSKYEICEEY